MKPRKQSSSGTLAATSSDHQLVALWLHGRASHTQRAYGSDAARLVAFLGKPLSRASLGDLQAFADSLDTSSENPHAASKARALAAVKSLLAFGHRTGLLPLNVGAALRLPKRRSSLGQRILTEAQVQRMLALESNPRKHALLRLLYGGGLRVSEACSLRWKDLQEVDDAGVIQIFGKGGKSRAVRVSKTVWDCLLVLAPVESDAEIPVFPGRNIRQPLSIPSAYRIVRAAGARAGIKRPVSPHFLRHAHASHALDRGCPIHLVQATLGHASVATTGVYLHVRPGESSGKYLMA